MVYVYKVTALCNIEKIPLKKRDKLANAMDEINIEVLNEYFYYNTDDNAYNSGFTSSYNTDIEFKFNDKEHHAYILSHICYHEKSDMMEQFKTLYKKEDFDLNTIFSYGAGDDIYSIAGISKINVLKIKNELVYEMYEGTTDDEDDYHCMSNFEDVKSKTDSDNNSDNGYNSDYSNDSDNNDDKLSEFSGSDTSLNTPSDNNINSKLVSNSDHSGNSV